MKRQKNVQLYARLISDKNPFLANYETDRGFPIKNFLSPLGLAKAYIQKKIKKNRINNVSDPYNLENGISEYIRKIKNEALQFLEFNTEDIGDYLVSDDLINIVSWIKWAKMNGLI